jgi:3-keto-5-aminohexanoate cleavage enzyme
MVAMRQVWVEAAVNGPWTRARQPRIPITVDEIVADGIACVRAGAAIVHVHPYDPATGLQREDPDVYQAIIEGIRAEVDAIVYPTLALLGDPNSERPMTAAERFATVAELCRRGVLEWAVVDPGSAHMTHVETPAEGFLYLNPDDHIRYGLDLAAAHGVRPAYACYEPGITRLGALLAKVRPTLPEPVYRFMFSDDLSFGFPPRDWALDAHVRLLDEVAPGSEWMVAGLCVDICPLIPAAVSRGGHVRVGLEDQPFGSERSNVDLVTDAVARIGDAGGRPATAAEVRTALAGR